MYIHTYSNFQLQQTTTTTPISREGKRKKTNNILRAFLARIISLNLRYLPSFGRGTNRSKDALYNLHSIFQIQNMQYCTVGIEEGWRERSKGKGCRVCLGGRFSLIPCRASLGRFERKRLNSSYSIHPIQKPSLKNVTNATIVKRRWTFFPLFKQ